MANGNESGAVCTEAERQDMEEKTSQSSHTVRLSVVGAHMVTRGSAEEEEGGAAVAEPRVARSGAQTRSPQVDQALKGQREAQASAYKLSAQARSRTAETREFTIKEERAEQSKRGGKSALSSVRRTEAVALRSRCLQHRSAPPGQGSTHG